MSGEVIADGVQEVLPGVFRWAQYSNEHKVELTSHAILRGTSLVLFDPIDLREAACRSLLERAKEAVVFLTSENHWRSTDSWLGRGLPVVTRTASGFRQAGVEGLSGTSDAWNGFQVVPLAGGPAGECVLIEPERRLGFGGDALVNLPGRGLEVLPVKYCANQTMLLDALGILAKSGIGWLFPAHGQPIGPRAGALIKELLDREKKEAGAHDRT
jgi:glyoxylase-like metal-dependent hydrolase (beta-lactamase superfamily II)